MRPTHTQRFRARGQLGGAGGTLSANGLPARFKPLHIRQHFWRIAMGLKTYF